WGLGVDPSQQIDVLTELGLGESTTGVRQVPGLHNGTKAFLFQVFGFKVAIQTHSYGENEMRGYLELESSGHRNEVRLHYHSSGSHHPHTEVFPYILADDKWHKLSLAISASHLILHVDCNKIYERVVEKPSTDLPLSRAEQRMNRLDQCYCERTCTMKGTTYRELESWTDGCKNCTCLNGTIQCETLICPNPDCPLKSALAYVDGKCCKECKRYDFCSERHNCMENSVCRNLNDRAVCSCRDGFRALREDNAYCEDVDECAEGRHYCRENTMCVNTPGSFMCICKTGYIRIDDYSCTDIDECSDGFVQCDSRANCINLPGWYHCECRDGYHDNGMFSPSGESCEDIDECGTGRHSCANDTICFNLDGGYDCRCPHGKNCTGDCIHDGKVKHNGQIWVLENDRCSVCSCQNGFVMCRRMVCDCENPTVDLFCCPECDPRLSSQCLHQNGETLYNSGDTWVQNCQQCRCLQGEVDCWPLPCPEVECEFSVLLENECCPRCVTDPCQANTIRNDITKTCLDEMNVVRFTGSSWIKHGTECTLCQC
ncbi:hypothetical protein EI555_010354, partial [Monodon monoceros]